MSSKNQENVLISTPTNPESRRIFQRAGNNPLPSQLIFYQKSFTRIPNTDQAFSHYLGKLRGHLDLP